MYEFITYETNLIHATKPVKIPSGMMILYILLRNQELVEARSVAYSEYVSDEATPELFVHQKYTVERVSLLNLSFE
jgi:hypothetical protein